MMQSRIFVIAFFAIAVLIVPYTAALSQQTEQEPPALIIVDAAVCRGVVDRKPVEPGDVFSRAVGELFCFTRVAGAQTDTEIVHEWYYKERMVSRVILPVRSGNWRTYSAKTIYPENTGQWMVKILSGSKEPLKQIYFVVN